MAVAASFCPRLLVLQGDLEHFSKADDSNVKGFELAWGACEGRQVGFLGLAGAAPEPWMRLLLTRLPSCCLNRCGVIGKVINVFLLEARASKFSCTVACGRRKPAANFFGLIRVEKSENRKGT